MGIQWENWISNITLGFHTHTLKKSNQNRSINVFILLLFWRNQLCFLKTLNSQKPAWCCPFFSKFHWHRKVKQRSRPWNDTWFFPMAAGSRMWLGLCSLMSKRVDRLGSCTLSQLPCSGILCSYVSHSLTRNIKSRETYIHLNKTYDGNIASLCRISQQLLSFLWFLKKMVKCSQIWAPPLLLISCLM